jgi:cytokinesis protein
MAAEKRRQYAEDAKVSRQKALDAASIVESEDNQALDKLLAQLSNGDAVGRWRRRARPSAENRPSAPSKLALDVSLPGPSSDTVDIARDMLARLQSDGFDAIPPSSPTAPGRQRRRRKRDTGRRSVELASEWIPEAESVAWEPADKSETSDRSVDISP